MANLDNPRGLRPAKHLDGKPWNGYTWRCCHLAADAGGATFVGDPVLHSGTACALGCCMSVTKGTIGTTNHILGVIASFQPVGGEHGITLDAATIGSRRDSAVYRVALTLRYVDVVIDPDVIYEIQASTGGAVARTAVNRNSNLISDHSGNTVTGMSGMEMLYSDSATTKAHQLHNLGAVPHPDNDISLEHSDWYVLLNTSALASCTAGRVLGV